jgi:hypothetical protein
LVKEFRNLIYKIKVFVFIAEFVLWMNFIFREIKREYGYLKNRVNWYK